MLRAGPQYPHHIETPGWAEQLSWKSIYLLEWKEVVMYSFFLPIYYKNLYMGTYFFMFTFKRFNNWLKVTHVFIEKMNKLCYTFMLIDLPQIRFYLKLFSCGNEKSKKKKRNKNYKTTNTGIIVTTMVIDDIDIWRNLSFLVQICGRYSKIQQNVCYQTAQMDLEESLIPILFKIAPISYITL